MMIIDKLAYSSKLRYKSPILKTAFAVGMLLICVAAHMLAAAVIILGFMAALTIRFSRVSFSHYMKLMGIPLGFLILSTLTIIFNISDTPGGVFAVVMNANWNNPSSGTVEIDAGALGLGGARVSVFDPIENKLSDSPGGQRVKLDIPANSFAIILLEK
jgi:hypothetical protein